MFKSEILEIKLVRQAATRLSRTCYHLTEKYGLSLWIKPLENFKQGNNTIQSKFYNDVTGSGQSG